MKQKISFNFSTENVKKTPKQIWREKLAEVKRQFVQLKSLGRTNVPAALSKLQDSVTALVDSVQNVINAEIKHQTGYTIQELKYKCGEGLKLFRQYKSLMAAKKEEIIEKRKDKKEKAKSEEYKQQKKEELKRKRAEAKAKFEAWLNKQSSEIYNAFMSIQILETVKELKSSLVKLEGTKLEVFKEIIDDANLILEFIGDLENRAEMEPDLKTALKSAGENFKDQLDSKIDDVSGTVGGMKNTIVNTADNLKEQANQIKENASNLVENTVDDIKNLGQNIKSSVTDTINDVTGSVKDVKDNINNFSDTVSGISNVKDMLNNSSSLLENMTNIQDDLKTIKNPVSTLTNNLNKFASSLSENQNTLGGSVSEIENIMKEGVSDMKNQVEKLKNELNIDDFLEDMISTGKTEMGNMFNASVGFLLKPICPYIRDIVKYLKITVEVLETIYTLIYNYQTNKQALKDDATKKAVSMLKTNSNKLGLKTSAPYSPSTSVLSKSNLPNPFFEDPPVPIPVGSQKEDMELMKFVMPVDDTEETVFLDGKHVTETPIPMNTEMHIPSSDEVYFCDENESPVFSELDRINICLDESVKDCQLNKMYNLISMSTLTNGGLLKNLQYSGNSREDLIWAILDINGGKRL